MKKKNTHHLIQIIIFFLIITSCKNKSNRVIVSSSPLIYYTKDKDQLDFYHEKFDNLVDSLNFFNNEGIRLAKDFKIDKSREAFLKGLNKNSTNVIILNNLGNLERDAKNFQKAIKYYQKSFNESDSLYFVAKLNLARTLSIIGKDIESEKGFYYIIDNSKLNFIKGLAYYLLTKNYLRYGYIDKGNNTFKKAKELLKENPDFNNDLIKLQNKLTNYYN